MYTTPRKVKQESRLRRTLSLTNTNRSHNGSAETEVDVNGTAADPGTNGLNDASINYWNQDGAFIERENRGGEAHFFVGREESSSSAHPPGDVERDRSVFQQYSNGLSVLPVPNPSLIAQDEGAQFHPPPYREPPALGKNSGPVPFFHDLPNLVPDYSAYQTHSSKFPIVREVVFSKESGSEPHPKVPSLSQYHKIQNRKLTTKQIAWTDERKAFTLDSGTAKDFQERLLFSPPTLTRRNSLDLEKFLKVFNEDQATVMASMQGGRLNNMEGVDNPALDLGPISHSHSHSQSNSGLYPGSGNKLGGYYPDSSNSQSLSLSSSTADSMDTVIYKGPGQPSPSIRDWQRSMDSNLDRTAEFNHRGDNGNAYRDSTMFVDGRSYQMQQTTSYHPHQFNGPGGPPQHGNGGPVSGTPNGNFAMDYHRSASHQAQQQQNQMLSVQSIPQHTISNNNGPNNHHNHPQPNGNLSAPNSNNGMAASNMNNVLRAGNNNSNNNNVNNNPNNQQNSVNSMATTSNGINNNHAPNGILQSKSYGSNPQLPAKSPLLTHKQFSPVSASATTTELNHHLLEGKSSGGKDSTKLFHTKTYNHIKDMISSRFGAASAMTHNNGSSSNPKAVNNTSNINSDVKSNVNNNTNNNMANNNPHPEGYGIQQQQQQQQQQHLSYNTPNGTVGGYYASPPTQSPSSYQMGLVNGGPHHHPHGIPNGGPPNSFRSPPMNDRKNVNTSFRKAIQKSTQKSNLTEESVPQMRPIMESTGNPGHNNNSREMYRPVQYGTDQGGNPPIGIHAERAQRALEKLCENGALPGQIGQFQRTGSGPILHHPHAHQGYNGNGPIPHNLPGTVVPAEARSPTGNPNGFGPQLGDNLGGHARHKFNTKASLASPPQGLAVVENSQSVSYSKGGGGITNEGFQGNDEYNEQPPPLPTSQHPGTAPHEQDMNTVGLPVLVEKRENGDGSSGTTETVKTMAEPVMVRSSCEQLKQITSELQNLAMSVSAEQQSSSSECEKGSQRVGSGQSHTTTDSGHGTVLLAKSPLHSSDPSEPMDGLVGQRHKFSENVADSISSGNDSEWVDIVEPEIRQILEMERQGKPPTTKASARISNAVGNLGNGGSNHNPRTSTGQGASGQNPHPGYNQGSRSHHPTQEHVGGGADDRTNSPSKKSPVMSPKLPKYDLNNYSKKSVDPAPGTSQQAGASAKTKSPRLPTKGVHRSNSNSGSARLNAWSSRQRLAMEKGKSSSRKDGSHKGGRLSRNAMSQILYSLHDDNGDITSTTTGLDLESMLDGPTENTSDDDDLSTTIDTTDAHAIRRQLESLEGMYTEVLKVLGGRRIGNRYPSSDLRNSKRRPYGSMSSLPSSVSSRPFREKKKIDDKKKVKDLKSINRRFQRLESHVVTLARSVAHLSSEMRTQHLMVQEMESIRNEMTQLRNQVVKASMQNHAAANGGFNRVASGRNGAMPTVNSTDWSAFRNALPSLTNPSRVRKLTKFFGDEPPLIRIFLKKLGYEKYASAFEQERIGIMELPYLTEERLNKMGIPMGPRLRILQEAHMCLKPHHHDGNHMNHHHGGGNGNLSVYVV